MALREQPSKLLARSGLSRFSRSRSTRARCMFYPVDKPAALVANQASTPIIEANGKLEATDRARRAIRDGELRHGL